jgi:glutamate dehydrogenase/leucine dehydrogenase
MPSRPVHSRRSFLRLSAAAAWCGPQIVASGVLRGATAPSRRLNVAVIGCGNRSRTLIPALLEEGAHIAALCDVEAAQIRGLKSGAPARDGRKRKDGGIAAGITKAREYGDFRNATSMPW